MLERIMAMDKEMEAGIRDIVFAIVHSCIDVDHGVKHQIYKSAAIAGIIKEGTRGLVCYFAEKGSEKPTGDSV